MRGGQQKNARHKRSAYACRIMDGAMHSVILSVIVHSRFVLVAMYGVWRTKFCKSWSKFTWLFTAVERVSWTNNNT